MDESGPIAAVLRAEQMIKKLRAEIERLERELSEDGVTARRRMRDDIEILRAENDQLRATASEWREVVEAMRAEVERLQIELRANDRLRQALRDFYDYMSPSNDFRPDSRAARQARAELGEQGKSDAPLSEALTEIRAALDRGAKG